MLTSDPATCPIIPGCETTIDISKGRTGLGLSIVGGADTLLVGWKNMCHSCEITVMKIKSDRRDFLSFVSKVFIERHKRNKNKKKTLSKIKSKNELRKYFGNFSSCI